MKFYGTKAKRKTQEYRNKIKSSSNRYSQNKDNIKYFSWVVTIFGSMLLSVGNEISNPRRQNTNKFQI